VSGSGVARGQRSGPVPGHATAALRGTTAADRARPVRASSAPPAGRARSS
jgi:hypothetical protein